MYIKFIDLPSPVEGSVSVKGNVATLKFKNAPTLNLSGFVCYLDKEMKFDISGETYLGFKTIYRNDEKTAEYNGYQLSNDGSVYVKPVYTTQFNVQTGGTITGLATQTVENYEDLIIPAVSTEVGYEFVKWSPEIPASGEIESDKTYTAIIEDKNIYFHCSGGGYLDGEVKQYAEDYSALVIPTPIADTDYKFVSWMPEIPTEGTVDNREFYAVFESNIPDRLGVVESDLTDTQMGLVENYDLSLSTAEEVTDCQMALVELYDMLLVATGGE